MAQEDIDATTEPPELLAKQQGLLPNPPSSGQARKRASTVPSDGAGPSDSCPSSSSATEEDETISNKEGEAGKAQ